MEVRGWERLIGLESTIANLKIQKILNMVLYNIPEEQERAKNQFEAMITLDTELKAAVETALNKQGEKDLQE